MADPTEPMTEPKIEQRGEYEIKIEIDEAQHDLTKNLGELKDAILEKVDVKGKIEDKVMSYVLRGREIAIDAYARGRSFVRDQPMVVVGVVGGVVLIAGSVLAIRHRLHATVAE